MTFNPGDPDEMTVQFSVNDDYQLERDEIFSINLELVSNSSGGQLGAMSTAVGIIYKDDSK